MFTYHDCTWCTDNECVNFIKCDKAYNDYHKVHNTDDLPIAVYTDRLECFEPKQ